MSVVAETPVMKFLNQNGSRDWAQAVEELLPEIHLVDKNAVQIWFAFHPLELLRALEGAEDPDRLAAQLLLEGNYYLKNQIDNSHTFLYGHRYWTKVKDAVTAYAESGKPGVSLASDIREVATKVAAQAGVQPSLTIAITAAAFMTLLQVGLERFKAASGTVQLRSANIHKSPDQVLKERAKDDSQGLLGFLKTIDKNWTVVFDENNPASRYKAINEQEVASGAAAEDREKWRAKDPRCLEGPIPVQCRSAACGTCWVGVLGGAEKLSEVQRLERNSMKRFGYIDTEDPKPLIRLACQAQTTGALSIVIPPWNGVFGKYLEQHANESEEVAV
jgi:ferredoxin